MNYTVYFIKDGKKLKWKCNAVNDVSAALKCRDKFGIILIVSVKENEPFEFLKDLFNFK